MSDLLMWLLGMEALFGWIIPIGLTITLLHFISENKNPLLYVLFILLIILSIVLWVYSWRKTDRIIKEEARKKNEERIKRENLIKNSPVNNLTPTEFEEFTALYMKSKGFTDVKMTKTTGDFGADIIARHSTGASICVQCKKYSKPVGIKAIQEIYTAKMHYNCQYAAVATTSVGYTKNAIELARDNGVLLFYFDDIERKFIIKK